MLSCARVSAMLMLAASSTQAAVARAATVETYEVRLEAQSLTHDTSDARTFAQRWLVNLTYWNEGEGPIFFYTGNEGPIEAFWEGNGFLRSLAPQFHAGVVFAEERYYGQSVPPVEYGYELTASLILADYAAVLRRNFSGVPIIAFGGSYGGTLATFFRASYPDVVAGAIAASAPIGYYDPARWAEFNVTADTFAEIIADAYRDCGAAIAGAVAAVRGTDVDSLVDVFFGVCSADALYGNSTDPAALFQYALESLPQLNYPYPVDGLPASPCGVVCETLNNAAARDDHDLVAAAANVTRMAFAAGSDECLPAFSEGPGGVPGDGPGLGSWGYQSCTETLHQFSSHTVVRSYSFNASAQRAICAELYDGVVPNTSALTAMYGGYDLPTTVTNVFWSNGLLDPWHGGGFFESDFPDSPNLFCVMPNGAHHLDLRGPRADDPPDVTACRAAETAAIETWLAAWREDRLGRASVLQELSEERGAGVASSNAAARVE